MQITSIRITLARIPDEPLKAVVSVLLNGQLMLRSIRVVERDGELVVYNPSKRNNENRIATYFRGKTAEDEAAFAAKILEAYKKAVETGESQIVRFDNPDAAPAPVEITRVSVYPSAARQDGFLAKVNFELDNQYCFSGTALRLGRNNSYRLEFPHRRLTDRTQYYYHPISAEIREKLLTAAIAEYEKSLDPMPDAG